MLLSAYHRLLVDISRSSGIHLDPPCDLSLSWVLKEGPILDKKLLAYIENGELEQPTFPQWLEPLWKAFITSDDARILRLLRESLVFCYKAEFEPTVDQLEAAVKQFQDTDDIVGVWATHFMSNPIPLRIEGARRLISRIICKANWRDITPSHGPGAVFPSRVPMRKSYHDTMYSSIQRLYPWDQHFCGIPSFWISEMVEESRVKIKELDHITCRIQAVPKDSRGPRLICVHPGEAIWIQQGQRHVLERCISNSPLTASNIKFDDQTVNGNIALTASASREYFTLDLSEASDRLSSSLIQFLFGSAYDWLASARADLCQLPSGEVKPLNKFAPMGNCLTFPIQSLVFWSVIRAGIRCDHGDNCDNIYVFGDDIIAPTKYYKSVISSLVMCGLVPNMSKTFHKGFFRESCGVDAYRGINVTPYRLRKRDVNSMADAVSVCDLAKRLRLSGYEFTPAYLYSLVSRWLGKFKLALLPCSNPNAQGIFEYVKESTPMFRYGNWRLNFNLQRIECRILLVTSRTIAPCVGDWCLLQDSLLSLARKGETISEGGIAYPVPYRERLTHGWVEV
jgi:hypothetical protein